MQELLNRTLGTTISIQMPTADRQWRCQSECPRSGTTRAMASDGSYHRVTTTHDGLAGGAAPRAPSACGCPARRVADALTRFGSISWADALM